MKKVILTLIGFVVALSMIGENPISVKAIEYTQIGGTVSVDLVLNKAGSPYIFS